MVGHELTAAEAAHPNAAVRQQVRQARHGAVNIIGGHKDIGSVRAETVRSEDMPRLQDAVSKLQAWRELGKWQTPEAPLSTAYMFGHAVHLRQPVIVLELTPNGLSYYDPARLFGM